MDRDICIDIDITYMDLSVLKYIKTLFNYDSYSSVVVALIGMYYNRLPSCEKKLIRLKADRLELEYGKSRQKI